MILEKSYWMFYGIHKLHCSIKVYEKKHLASICFKWLVALKSRPSKNTLLYTITKKLKRVFLWYKSHWVLRSTWACSLTGLPLGFTVIGSSVVFRFLIDRIFFRILSDRAIFESSMLGSSSVPAVLDFSVGSSSFFFHHAAIFFYQIVLLLFFIKNRCFNL